MTTLKNTVIVVLLSLWRAVEQFRVAALLITALGVWVFFPDLAYVLACIVLVVLGLFTVLCLLSILVNGYLRGAWCDRCGQRVPRDQMGTPCPHDEWEHRDEIDESDEIREDT